MNRRSVVTGGAGVIGQELVAMLISRGDKVRIVDRLPRPDTFGSDVEYIQGDLTDLHSSAIAAADPQVIFHLAAAFERSEENPDFWRQNAHDNVVASQRVLAAACESPSLRRYVFASSYLVYDTSEFLVDEPPDAAVLLTEDSLIDPRNACGAAKLLHEKEATLAAESSDNDFTVVSARIYRVYGRSSRDVVSRWIRAGINEEPITVFGAESYFDYVHARDVAEGLLRLAETQLEGPVNLASGRSERVSTLVENVTRHFPRLVVRGPFPAETYEASQADLSRLETATSWRPRISLEEGVTDLVAHEQENKAHGTVSRRVLDPRTANILISSVSRKAALVRAARAAIDASLMVGAVGGSDSDPEVPTRFMLDYFWDMGPLDELTDSEIVDSCRDRGVTLLIPTRDGELARFAALRELLGSVGTFVPIGSEESVRNCLDKLLTAQICGDAGIPIIETATSLDRLATERFVVKDRFGAGSRSIALNVSRVEALAAAEKMNDPLFQVFESGPEFSIDAYVDRAGTLVGSVVRERRTVVNGESQVTTTVRQERIDDVARGAIAATGVRGHVVVQVIDGPTGARIVEINSRVGGASTASFAAGLPSIQHMLTESRGESVALDTDPLLGVTLIRLPADTVTFQ